MYKKISYSELIKKLESHNRWFKGFNGKELYSTMASAGQTLPR